MYEFLFQTLNRGDLVYVDDGLISLKVTEKTDKTLITSLLATPLIIPFTVCSCSKWWHAWFKKRG